jgi:hypothetical protein
MQNDDIYLYADVNHVDYKKFTLSPDAPANPANKDKVIVPIQKKRNKISMWRLDNNDDDNNDNSNDDYFATPKKRNNNASKQKHKKRKTTINHDFLGVQSLRMREQLTWTMRRRRRQHRR